MYRLGIGSNYDKWLPRKGVEIMVSEKPRVLYVRNDKGIVAFPEGVFNNFKSIDQIVDLVGPYLERG